MNSTNFDFFSFYLFEARPRGQIFNTIECAEIKGKIIFEAMI